MKQGDLIPLTPDELRMRGPMLARLTLELDEMKVDHAEEKKGMTAAEKELALRIRKLARSIRDGRAKDEA